MNRKEKRANAIMEVCLLAGKIMLQNGAETYRVEDTMERIALSFGVKEPNCYVTPTGIMFSIDLDGKAMSKLIRITERTTNLQKVARVNRISRAISLGERSVEEAYNDLHVIEQSPNTFPIIIRILAAALASGCFVLIFKGSVYDVLPGFVAGGIGLWMFILCKKFFPINFFAEFVSSVVIGLLSILFVKIGIGLHLDKIIIGGVMPLVPGLLLTNGVRDLMAGHLVSGLSKGAEAILTAFAIGSGIAVVLGFL